MRKPWKLKRKCFFPFLFGILVTRSSNLHLISTQQLDMILQEFPNVQFLSFVLYHSLFTALTENRHYLPLYLLLNLALSFVVRTRSKKKKKKSFPARPFPPLGLAGSAGRGRGGCGWWLMGRSWWWLWLWWR